MKNIEIIYNGDKYDVTKFARYHPGGEEHTIKQ